MAMIFDLDLLDRRHVKILVKQALLIEKVQASVVLQQFVLL
jgi:hypothetical protein